MGDSRASSAAKQNMKSTRGSFFTKVTGRDSKPTWGNRIVKDFNDLQYDVSIDRFSKPNRFKNNDLLKRRKVQADLRSRRSSRNKVQASSGPHDVPFKAKSVSRNGKNQALNSPLPNPERLYMSSL